MEPVKKSRKDWVCRFITDESVWGLVSGYSIRKLETTCDIRKYFILKGLKCIVVPAVVLLMLSAMALFAVINPILVAYSLFVDGVSAVETGKLIMAAFGVLADICMMFIMLSEYGYIPESVTKATDKVAEGFEIIKSKVCSKVEWDDETD